MLWEKLWRSFTHIPGSSCSLQGPFKPNRCRVYLKNVRQQFMVLDMKKHYTNTNPLDCYWFYIAHYTNKENIKTCKRWDFAGKWTYLVLNWFSLDPQLAHDLYSTYLGTVPIWDSFIITSLLIVLSVFIRPAELFAVHVTDHVITRKSVTSVRNGNQRPQKEHLCKSRC